MRVRLIFALAAAQAALLAFVACNDPALCGNGRCDEVFDATDARASKDTGTTVDGTVMDGVDASDAGAVDAGPLVIPVSRTFTSLNDASFTTDEAGTRITGYGATHPVIVPSPQPSIPSEDYTLIATLLAPSDAEFGVLTRMENGGACVLFGSKYGTPSVPYPPYLSTMGPPAWDPSAPSYGTPFTFVANTRYKFKVVAKGQMISAKLWDATTAEPAAFSTFESTTLTGRGVGFYSYGATPTVVEDMVVTVP